MYLDVRADFGISEACYDCPNFDFTAMEVHAIQARHDHVAAINAGLDESAIRTLDLEAQLRERSLLTVAETVVRNCHKANSCVTKSTELTESAGECGVIKEVMALVTPDNRGLEAVIIKTGSPY